MYKVIIFEALTFYSNKIFFGRFKEIKNMGNCNKRQKDKNIF